MNPSDLYKIDMPEALDKRATFWLPSTFFHTTSLRFLYEKYKVINWLIQDTINEIKIIERKINNIQKIKCKMNG